MGKKGLTDIEVKESREKNGANIIPDSEPTTFWEEFKETFSDPMIKILLFIVVIMLVMFFMGQAEIYEPIGTVVAVLIVAFVTAKTGVASDTKYRELKESTKKDTCKVYRNGIISVIEIDDVVVGDRVILQSGDKVPADGILVEGDLRVDNSVLNGEAEECEKTWSSVTTTLSERSIQHSSLHFLYLSRLLHRQSFLSARRSRQRQCLSLIRRQMRCLSRMHRILSKYLRIQQEWHQATQFRSRRLKQHGELSHQELMRLREFRRKHVRRELTIRRDLRQSRKTSIRDIICRQIRIDILPPDNRHFVYTFLGGN